MSTSFGTIADDLKVSLGLAKSHVLSYFLANLGMAVVIVVLLAMIGIPLAIITILTGGLVWASLGSIATSWAMSNPWVVGSMGVMSVIPIVSLFLVVVGSVYGMSNDLVLEGETKAELAFSYLRRKFLSFVGAGAVLTVIIVLPLVLLSVSVGYYLNLTVVSPNSTILTAISVAWIYVSVGLTSMVLPAIVNGKGVQAAVKESLSLSTRYFDRVFGLLTAIILLAVVMFSPALLLAYGLSTGLVSISTALTPAFAAVAISTAVAVLLWIFLLLPMVKIAFVKVYHDLTGGQVATQSVLYMPVV
ncbi:MAG: hypothetical protein ACE5H4_07330 [Candidatus Thorarchaeota archaeon]